MTAKKYESNTKGGGMSGKLDIHRTVILKHT
jgi:hypothetical protein